MIEIECVFEMKRMYKESAFFEPALNLYYSGKEKVLVDGRPVALETGIKISTNDSCGLIVSRYKPTVQHGLIIHNGFIEPEYSGIIKVIISSFEPVYIKQFDSIAKLFFIKHEFFKFKN